jgi:hypothetical protein
LFRAPVAATQLTTANDTCASADAWWVLREPVTAWDVHVGDLLFVGPGSTWGNMTPSQCTTGGLQLAHVEVKRREPGIGYVAPVTLAGTIVVEGVAASVYSDALGSEATMHAIVNPLISTMTRGGGDLRIAKWLEANPAVVDLGSWACKEAYHAWSNAVGLLAMAAHSALAVVPGFLVAK